MEGPRQKIIKVVLDGTTTVGKSVLFKRLMTGNYGVVKPTDRIDFGVHKVMINQVQYKTQIWDTSGLRQLKTIYVFYSQTDVIVEFFDISRPVSLEESIHHRIPYLRKQLPGVPILLVGTKADLRGAKNVHLFPVELGPLLARCIGAVKYMECSSKTNFNVYEVFEEAVRCSLSESKLEVIDKYLYAVMNIADIDGEWAEHLNKLNLFPDNNAYLQEDTDLVEQIIVQTPSEIKEYFKRKDVFVYRVLEIDRLLIAQGLPGTRFDVCKSAPPTCTLLCVHNCTTENVVCSSCPISLQFLANDCKSIASFLINSGDQMKVRSLVIVNCTWTLDFSFLAKITGLETLIIVNTEVDLTSLTFPPHLQDTMKHLVLNNCGIIQATDVPSEIGNLVNLQILNLTNNNFKKIPKSLGFLCQLHTILIDQDNVYFPPPEVLKKSARDVINFLRAIEENPVANTGSKLIVVGQEGVGKSTLVKAMKRSWWLTKNEPPPKTDGVDTSLQPFKDIHCKVYDLAGDVEYLNTHSLFLSSNTLHLVVFELSRLIVDKKAQSTDHLCRLELWLETIASQDPKSRIILVGTHADHPLVNKGILNQNRKLLTGVLIKHCSSHRTLFRIDPCEECFVCTPETCPENLECFMRLLKDTSGGEHSNSQTTGQIPHVLGYFEVSSIKKYPSLLLGFHNVNIEKLKSLTASSISNIMKTVGIDQIPERWLLFRDTIAQKLSSDDVLQQQPMMSFSQVYDIALKLQIHLEERVIAMLRFFHCQGTYLWFEELPEMKNIVILDPQWLSDQLRTLISHRHSVSPSICEGVLRHSELSTVWGHISEKNRRRLLSLFRSVGLCFSISDTEELFPCNMPVGWPDREIWPPVPNREENQTSLLFTFSFIPPSFFPDLTVEVNRKSETFARNVKPLYYRFHILYIRKDTSLDASRRENATTHEDNDVCFPTQHSSVLHTVHYELMPYNNSLTVAVRGPDPPSIIPEIRSMIETVKRRRYPGITYSERLLCPECVLKRVQPLASFGYDIPHDGVCSKGHKVGTNQSIFEGRYSSAEIVPSAIGQTSRVVGETLEDHFCPKLFVVLPVNLECLSLKDRFVYSYLRDGFAVHLLCECPDQWHFVDSPGFRVGKPKEFFEKYGSRACKALRFISTLSMPIKAAASLDPHCKIGAAVGAGAKSVSQELQFLLDSYLDKYPHLKPTLGSSKDDLKNLKSSSGLQRSELCRFLEVEAKGRNFGPLVCTYVDKHDEWLWLCEEHNERFEIVQREDEND